MKSRWTAGQVALLGIVIIAVGGLLGTLALMFWPDSPAAAPAPIALSELAPVPTVAPSETPAPTPTEALAPTAAPPTGPTATPRKDGAVLSDATATRAAAQPTARPKPGPTAPPRPRPTAAPAPSGVRIGAVCKDGTRSSATGRGACSHHGGVAYWLYR